MILCGLEFVFYRNKSQYIVTVYKSSDIFVLLLLDNNVKKQLIGSYEDKGVGLNQKNKCGDM